MRTRNSIDAALAGRIEAWWRSRLPVRRIAIVVGRATLVEPDCPMQMGEASCMGRGDRG